VSFVPLSKGGVSLPGGESERGAVLGVTFSYPKDDTLLAREVGVRRHKELSEVSSSLPTKE